MPSRTSGIVHQAVARTTEGSHHMSWRRPRADGGRESRYRPTGSRDASVEDAFTPPMNGIRSADRVAEMRAVVRGLVSGSSTHGRNAPGRAAADVEPMTIVNVGHSAYATAPSSRL